MNHTEAPASVNYKVTYKGVEIQFTQRDLTADIQPYMDQAKKDIDYALANGFTAPPQKAGSGRPPQEVEYVKDEQCPKCRKRLILKHKKDGGTYNYCEDYKYDFKNKKSIGVCDYINWNNV